LPRSDAGGFHAGLMCLLTIRVVPNHCWPERPTPIFERLTLADDERQHDEAAQSQAALRALQRRAFGRAELQRRRSIIFAWLKGIPSSPA
jgi:hypothetical protein